MNKGILIVLSGPSGVGKGTMKDVLKGKLPLAESVSATTRAMREGEIQGKSYHFISVEEFAKRREAGEFLECFENFGNFYGTLKSEVENALQKGDVLLEIDVKGGLEIKKKIPEAVLIMVAPPSVEILKSRLAGRGTESAEDLKTRLNLAKEELSVYTQYDYVVINEVLPKAVAEVEHIIKTCHLESGNMQDFMEKLLV